MPNVVEGDNVSKRTKTIGEGGGGGQIRPLPSIDTRITRIKMTGDTSKRIKTMNEDNFIVRKT